MPSDGDAPNGDFFKQAMKQLEVFDQPLLTLARSLWPSLSDDKLIAGVHIAEWVIALIVILFVFEVTSLVTRFLLIGLIGCYVAVIGIGTSRLDNAFLIGLVSVCTSLLWAVSSQLKAADQKLEMIKNILERNGITETMER